LVFIANLEKLILSFYVIASDLVFRIHLKVLKREIVTHWNLFFMYRPFVNLGEICFPIL
jgi:hypothetical protein